MRKIRLFSIAALALAMAACSSEENTLETQSPAAPGKLHFTATIATPDNGAGTRTEYSEQTDGTINVAWKENDKIAAIVINSEKKYVKTELTVSKVNADGSAVISGDIAKPKDDALMVDLIYPASIVTVAANGSAYSISFDKMSDGTTLDGTLKSIYENIDYRRADGCALAVSGDKATLTSAAKLESKLSIWKLTLQDKDGNPLSASKVAIVSSGGVAVASATLSTAGATAYLPVPAATGDICISATTADNDYFYMKEGVALAAKKYYQSTLQMTKGAHLAFLSADYEAKDGAILTGTLANKVKISIAAPVTPATTTTVTLKDVNISGTNDDSYDWAGITCLGSATIILEGTNSVTGFYENYPGIHVPEGNTLTIQGTGSLTANGSGYGAGIGGGFNIPCGNIVIKGGNITATGGGQAAGIGGGYNASCGNIEISGGTITATSVDYGAGIGGGDEGSCGTITINGGTVEATGGSGGAGIGGGHKNGTCGTITITNGVTKVKATAGESAPNSIGAGYNGTAITVTIGGVVGAITTSPYEYSPIPATAHTLATSAVGDVIDTNGNAYTLDATHVLPSGVTAVAMVAYKSGSNGLAIQLNGSPVSKNWDDAKTYAEGLTAVSGGTWRLPSKEDWKDMIVGCAVSGDATVLNVSNALDPINGFKAKIAATGITWQSTGYWSSTESHGKVWGVAVRLDQNYAFFSDGIFEELAVLGCLAF